MSVADVAVLVPMVAVIIFSALYPQFVLERSERAVETSVADPGGGRRIAVNAAPDAPHIDYAGLSPLIALTGRTCVTLLAGLFRGARGRAPSVSRRC